MESIESVEVRVRALERRQGHLQWSCAVLAIALALSVAWPALRVPREVYARRFVLKDASGGTRGTWGPVDVLAAEIDGEQQHASASCLVMNAATPTDGTLRLCAPWERYGGPSISMRERTGASLHIVLDAYTLSILGKTSPTAKGNRGALVLGVWQDSASIQTSDKTGRRTQ